MGTVVTKENCKVGLKVVRGPDWEWGDQDEGSIYGIIQKEPEILGINDHKGLWVYVSWIHKMGEVLSNNYNYRIDVKSEKHDLQIYEEPVIPTIDDILLEMDPLERAKQMHQKFLKNKS